MRCSESECDSDFGGQRDRGQDLFAKRVMLSDGKEEKACLSWPPI